MLFLYRPPQSRMPFARPRDRTQQAAYNRHLQTEYEASRRVAPAPVNQLPPPPPPATPAAPAFPYDELKQLAELRDSGVLTQDEFDAAKAKVLDR